jgi:hypothetical protein
MSPDRASPRRPTLPVVGSPTSQPAWADELEANVPDRSAGLGCGLRVNYRLRQYPRAAEPLLRKALPLIAGVYEGNRYPDFSKLSDTELRQLRTALAAADGQTA